MLQFGNSNTQLPLRDSLHVPVRYETINSPVNVWTRANHRSSYKQRLESQSVHADDILRVHLSCMQCMNVCLQHMSMCVMIIMIYSHMYAGHSPTLIEIQVEILIAQFTFTSRGPNMQGLGQGQARSSQSSKTQSQTQSQTSKFYTTVTRPRSRLGQVTRSRSRSSLETNVRTQSQKSNVTIVRPISMFEVFQYLAITIRIQIQTRVGYQYYQSLSQPTRQTVDLSV